MRCIAAALLVLLVACGGDDSGLAHPPKDAPDCADLYAEGAPMEPILERNEKDLGEAGSGCINDEGDLEVQAMASYPCGNGETAYYNQYGWGVSGDVWHHYEHPGDNSPPSDAC